MGCLTLESSVGSTHMAQALDYAVISAAALRATTRLALIQSEVK